MDGHAKPENGTPVKARRNNRKAAILDAAAHRFRHQGFAATTMREVAADAGMLAGSMYYHFPSKSALLLAVHREGVTRIEDAVAGALEGCSSGDPWARLEAALHAHLTSLLGGGDYAQVVIRDLPAEDAALRGQLIELRDRYENLFRDLIDALPCRDPAQRPWLRLMLLGAANWSKTWFRTEGPATPETIAENFIRLLRDSVE